MIARAIDNRTELPYEPPPDDRCHPDPTAPEDSDDRVAIELFCRAMGADLHHELTRIRRGHGGPGGDSIEQEREADAEAARWLIGDMGEHERPFEKRSLGLALSQIYEVFLKLEGHESDRAHPPLVGRLRDAIAGRATDPDQVVWAFVAAVLSLHLEWANRRREYDRDVCHPTYRHMAEHLMGVYERV